MKAKAICDACGKPIINDKDLIEWSLDLRGNSGHGFLRQDFHVDCSVARIKELAEKVIGLEIKYESYE